MFEHKRKTIGKSFYYISEFNGVYRIKEIYNKSIVGKSNYTHRNIDDALQELNNISTERYYTDDSKNLDY